jgi:hypothetical protein
MFRAWSKISRPVIGMLHLPPLPGSPRFETSRPQIQKRVLNDAQSLAEGGVAGLIIENFGDMPFYPGRVPAFVAAEMSALAVEVRRRFDLPLGINVLRNDGQTALAVAAAAGAQFIRVNVLCGARLSDQGIIQGIAHDLLRDRSLLHAHDVKIFADVDVKHSAPLAQRPIGVEVEDTIHRGLADALIVSGAGTAKTTDAAKLSAVKAAAGKTPVFVGSGVTAHNIGQYLTLADGLIIGSAFKVDGCAQNPVDPRRVKELIGQIPSAS